MRSITNKIINVYTVFDKRAIQWKKIINNISVANVRNLEHFGALDTINLMCWRNNTMDISFLKRYGSLRRLTIEMLNISDISPIEDLKNLRYLSLYSMKLEDISPYLQQFELGSLEFVL